MNTNLIREGDLYEVIEFCGKRYEIRYGYYEDYERDRIEPVPIYPLFNENPEYSPGGYLIATRMQLPCQEYQLRDKNINNEECADCIYFECGENSKFGLCRCEKRRIRIGTENETAPESI